MEDFMFIITYDLQKLVFIFHMIMKLFEYSNKFLKQGIKLSLMVII